MVTSYRSARDVGDEEREEVERGEELVVGAEAWVEPGPLVVDQALVLTVGKAAQRDRRPLHVGEEALEAHTIEAVDPSLPVDGETGMLPGPHALHGLRPHLLAPSISR
jgi:hypothetical protein